MKEIIDLHIILTADQIGTGLIGLVTILILVGIFKLLIYMVKNA